MSSMDKKYGGFFFANDKEGAEYYCFDGAKDEENLLDAGDVTTVVYGDEESGWYFINSILVEDDDFEDVGNAGPFKDYDEAYQKGRDFIEDYNKSIEQQVNPYLYPVHLRMEKPYIHNTLTDGFVTGSELIKRVSEMDKGYDGIKITDTFDGDRVMDVYIAFDPKNIMILDKFSDSPGLKVSNDLKSPRKGSDQSAEEEVPTPINRMDEVHRLVKQNESEMGTTIKTRKKSFS